MNGKRFLMRTASIVLVLMLICGWFLYLLYDAQVVHVIKDLNSANVNLTSTNETVAAARGCITDRYGRVLVGNQTVYQVDLDIDHMGDEIQQAKTVLRLIEICQEQGLVWNNKEFPVAYEDASGHYAYTTDTPFNVVSNGVYTATRLSKLCQSMEWGTGAGVAGTTADSLIQQMSTTFALPASLSPTDRLEVLGVLYSALLRAGVDQLIWTEYHFLDDVDFAFITRIKEEGLEGVNVIATAERSYDTDYAGVLLGQVGAISAERWQKDKDTFLTNGYTMDSIIGLSGVEAAFESYLRGTSGVKRVTRDLNGNVVSESYLTEPKAGNNVTLTLDIGLQEACEEALEKYTYSINEGNGGSAVVVVDIHSGEVLAMASYPTFSAAEYSEKYAELAADPLLPLYNRALLGTYAPGSTYKICSATAGLEAGYLTTETEVNCTGTYQYFDARPRCWKRSGHGLESVEDAIRDSCNVFFYDVSVNIGIDKLTETAQAYGLGLPTGIELAESTGVNAGPAHSEKVGATWYLGNVMSAAIGQSDNQFTILQLANYIATFINGGDRYAAHLLKSVKSNDNRTIVKEPEPEVVTHVDLSRAGYDAIKSGMGQVIAADQLEGIFANLTDMGIKVGCKTGTIQLGKTGLHNGTFVSFAPFEDPEIAVCTIVEKASSGASTSAITAAIMEYYFSDEAELERATAENTLIH